VFWFLVVSHVLGLLSALRALFETRTPQGTIAWSLSLVFVPYVALPFYWTLGRSRFDGYRFLRSRRGLARSDAASRVRERLEEAACRFEPQGSDEARFVRVLERIARLPFTRGNAASLLIDGHGTFEEIFRAIRGAKDYVLVEFYILRGDRIGQELSEVLCERAAAGVRVHVLFDELGSHQLPRSYCDGLRRGGVNVRPFDSSRNLGVPLHLNFRNHRKIVVIDGKRAFVGGHNVGDEYLGRHEELTPWRDTHIEVQGPAVLGAQMAFAEDWLWSSGERLELSWEPVRSDAGDMAVLFVPSGPADSLETATLMMLEAIGSARRRLWVVSPYFVPENELLCALQLASLRGVDVRILLPARSDEKLVHLSSFSYLEDLDRAGVRLDRYQPGFLHQKVVLVDDDLAAVGTTNFDNRSMRLNFEITGWVIDREFAQGVERMLIEDYKRAVRIGPEDYSERSFFFRLAVRFARLLAPIQ
jgi:cardiolipin synthase A/B